MDLLGIGQANCFRTHNELTMGLLGKYPLAPSVISHEAKVIRVVDVVRITGDECKGGWRVGHCIVRELQRIARNSNATQDIREGRKVKIQCADNNDKSSV